MVGPLCILQIIFTWPHTFQDALGICIGLLMQRVSALDRASGVERGIIIRRTRKVVDTGSRILQLRLPGKVVAVLYIHQRALAVHCKSTY